MKEKRFESLLRDLVEYADSDGAELNVRSVDTFENAGILTRNRGLVISLVDGSEFQLTIVQSQRSTSETDDEDED
jgi:hypothetical protein